MLAGIGHIDFVFTITAGRSGTKLLAELLTKVAGINAFHEPAPRMNYVFRSFVESPAAARHWLETEKFPAILSAQSSGVYVETSHLFCKGFIEPTIEMGIKPKFIILTREARQVAESHYQLNVIPGRTAEGRLVLLRPSDPGVMWLPNWTQYSDYQLCYWYALEIERRQRFYKSVYFSSRSLSYFELDLRQLQDWDIFRLLCKFIAGDGDIDANRGVYETIVSRNQHPRYVLNNGRADRLLPHDAEEQERQVILALSEN